MNKINVIVKSHAELDKLGSCMMEHLGPCRIRSSNSLATSIISFDSGLDLMFMHAIGVDGSSMIVSEGSHQQDEAIISLNLYLKAKGFSTEESV